MFELRKARKKIKKEANESMLGLAKKADVDVASLIANGIKRIPQMDDLAGLAIVANGKKRQAQGQNQNNDEQNPPEFKNQ